MVQLENENQKENLGTSLANQVGAEELAAASKDDENNKEKADSEQIIFDDEYKKSNPIIAKILKDFMSGDLRDGDTLTISKSDDKISGIINNSNSELYIFEYKGNNTVINNVSYVSGAGYVLSIRTYDKNGEIVLAESNANIFLDTESKLEALDKFFKRIDDNKERSKDSQKYILEYLNIQPDKIKKNPDGSITYNNILYKFEKNKEDNSVTVKKQISPKNWIETKFDAFAHVVSEKNIIDTPEMKEIKKQVDTKYAELLLSAESLKDLSYYEYTGEIGNDGKPLKKQYLINTYTLPERDYLPSNSNISISEYIIKNDDADENSYLYINKSGDNYLSGDIDTAKDDLAYKKVLEILNQLSEHLNNAKTSPENKIKDISNLLKQLGDKSEKVGYDVIPHYLIDYKTEQGENIKVEYNKINGTPMAYRPKTWGDSYKINKELPDGQKTEYNLVRSNENPKIGPDGAFNWTYELKTIDANGKAETIQLDTQEQINNALKPFETRINEYKVIEANQTKEKAKADAEKKEYKRVTDEIGKLLNDNEIKNPDGTLISTEEFQGKLAKIVIGPEVSDPESKKTLEDLKDFNLTLFNDLKEKENELFQTKEELRITKEISKLTDLFVILQKNGVNQNKSWETDKADIINQAKNIVIGTEVYDPVVRENLQTEINKFIEDVNKIENSLKELEKQKQDNEVIRVTEEINNAKTLEEVSKITIGADVYDQAIRKQLEDEITKARGTINQNKDNQIDKTVKDLGYIEGENQENKA